MEELVLAPQRVDRRLARWARSPLAWAVTLETVLAIALVAVAWHVLHTPRSLAMVVPDFPGERPSPTPLPNVTIPAAGHTQPGNQANLNRDPSFVRGQLNQINRDQSAWERAQWSLVDALTKVVRGYVDKVVVPAVEHASNRGP